MAAPPKPEVSSTTTQDPRRADAAASELRNITQHRKRKDYGPIPCLSSRTREKKDDKGNRAGSSRNAVFSITIRTRLKSIILREGYESLNMLKDFT